MKTFASDNNAGVHPRIMDALNACNKEHVIGYGDDEYTRKAIKTFKSHFNDQTEVFFVYGGTGANVLAVSSVCRPFESVICAQSAHINVDECGAPERFSAAKLVDIPTADGKLTPQLIRPFLQGFDFEHHSQPKLISISQPTELGTVYSLQELKALRALADEFGLCIHIDGARIANAAEYLGCSFKEMIVDCGIDVVSFGGNKNGLMFGEALLFFNRIVSKDFKYIRKQAMQLHSKMRFISAQFNIYLESGLWKENAAHSNRMARLLLSKIKNFSQINVTQKVESNAVFVTLPKETISKLQKESFFYDWDRNIGEVRWMTAFDTTEQDIDDFITILKKYLK
jgi:threonine aldolase